MMPLGKPLVNFVQVLPPSVDLWTPLPDNLKEDYAAFDANEKFDIDIETVQESTTCIAGEILKGIKKPHQCTAFGKTCTPEHPLGAPMVSSEGACAAYYHFSHIEINQ